jgi:universal stress protein E
MSILVATDLADASLPAVHMGALFAAARGTELRLLHVVDFTGDDNAWRVLYETADEIQAHATQEATAGLVAHYKKAIPAEHQRAFSSVVRFGRPADGVMAEATKTTPAMIVVGTVGQSWLQDVFFGRTANQLVRESHLPILAVPPGTKVASPKKILVAVDLSDCGDRALTQAKELAALFGATLDVVHAVDVDAQSAPLSALVPPIQLRFDEIVASRKAGLDKRMGDLNVEGAALHIEFGRPDRVIKEAAEKLGADFVVMGTHGRQGFSRFFLGSTAERILRATSVPTLVVSSPK